MYDIIDQYLLQKTFQYDAYPYGFLMYDYQGSDKREYNQFHLLQVQYH